MKDKIKDASSAILTFLIIYGVSATFFFPLLAALFCVKIIEVCGGWPVGHITAGVLCVAYFYRSYGGRPEKKSGRIWLNLNKWWTLSHGYFPVKLKVWDGTSCVEVPSQAHKKALPAQFILALHPHGPFPLSASVLMPQLARFGAPLGDLFASVRFAAASAVFALPVVRDMYLSLGCIEAGRHVLTRAVGKGLSIAILPGGEQEQLLVCPDSSPYEDVVPPRDGLFRLAIANGVPLVPAFSFGERRAFTASNFLLPFRLRLVQRHRIGVPWAWGRHKWFPFVPHPTPVTIVIGKPLPLVTAATSPGMVGASVPSIGKGSSSSSSSGFVGNSDGDKAAVAALRARYLSAVDELFEAHKGSDEVAKTKTLRWVERPGLSGKGD